MAPSVVVKIQNLSRLFTLVAFLGFVRLIHLIRPLFGLLANSCFLLLLLAACFDPVDCHSSRHLHATFLLRNMVFVAVSAVDCFGVVLRIFIGFDHFINHLEERWIMDSLNYLVPGLVLLGLWRFAFPFLLVYKNIIISKFIMLKIF